MATKRTLLVQSITDGFTYSITDSVNDKSEPTQQRLAAEKMLKKKVPVLDGAPGELIPLFRLVKEPAVFSPHDQFDTELLKDADGKWLFASDKWKDEQKKRIGKRSDSAARAEAQVKASAANKVMEGLTSLIASQGAPAKSTPKKNGAGES